ncbi:ribosome recycling factor [Hyphobacterium sp. HN65]|uniref:Ribosome-recycling factor n=1 Tax=Hyphobacterium lacteum TaxID=3116575 RepID=A0ABU7LNH8_9PROT|nr:ribosome recycling factor [Hyphobacterium sp. HN65]MEE2524894.1 ribosome recycling factor [Hyphobacterium sp. HN65]
MSASIDLKDLQRRMDGALDALHKDFGSLRTGRASASLLDAINVEAYGSPTPINQVGTVSVPEPRMISVQVWDKELVGAVDKAIRNSPLGVNPVVEGTLLRIPIPPLNEERRAELAKAASSYAEHARVAIRNVRRDGMDTLKQMEKDGEISEDELKSQSDSVQKLTDDYVGKVDSSLKSKQDEIMQV